MCYYDPGCVHERFNATTETDCCAGHTGLQASYFDGDICSFLQCFGEYVGCEQRFVSLRTL